MSKYKYVTALLVLLVWALGYTHAYRIQSMRITALEIHHNQQLELLSDRMSALEEASRESQAWITTTRELIIKQGCDTHDPAPKPSRD